MPSFYTVPPITDEAERELPPSRPRQSKGWLLGLLGLLALLFIKFKGLLFLLLFKLKSVIVLLKLGKLLTTGFTMLATIWVYALFFGWLFAVGFVLLIFLHEMGHAYVIKQKGLRAGAPVFIPFVGAMIALKDQPRDAKTEAEIAYGGPLAGALASLGCYYLGEQWGSPLLLGLAYTGFFMNLFNLIPVSPLDGGRIVTAISTKLWIVGLFLLLFLFLRSFNPLLLIVLVMGGIQLWQVYRQGDQTSAYYEVPPSYRTAMAIAYFGLAGFLGAMIMKVLPMLPALR